MARLNLLILMTDQHRYDAVGCYGERPVQTPAIDSIAESGVRFDRAYTPVALCSPSRGSLVTGQYPHNHGQLANRGNFNAVFDTQILEETAVSYPYLLAESGYRVGHVGKWHLPKPDADVWGFEELKTTDDWYDWLREKGIDYDRGRDDVQRLEWGGEADFHGRSTLAAEDMQETWVADRLVESIGRDAGDDEPFALCGSFFGPHFPYAVPEPFYSMYDPDDVERPESFSETFEDKPDVQEKEQRRWNAGHLTWSDWQAVTACYWGYCSFIDDQVERVLDALEETGVADDTVVVFTTDHGSMLGAHRLFNKGYNMYEELHHVPLLAQGPGIAEGSVREEFVELVDLMPTLLDAAGVDVPDTTDGRSLVPLLRGESPTDWRETAYAEFHGMESTLYSSRMVRTEDWKYVYNPASRDELYDLDSDPAELENLADRSGHAPIRRRMKARLVERLRASGDTIVEEDSWKGSAYDLYISERER